jgi:hypothetical protein
MKKIMLGLVAAFALASFAAPVRAEEAAPPATDGAKKEKKAKKADKKGEAAPAGDAAAAPKK